MEAEEGETSILRIGKYVFSSRAFERASRVLDEALQQKSGWIIVDEIGPLELQEKGFYQIVKRLLTDMSENVKLIFVVRKNLLAGVVSFFEITGYLPFAFSLKM
jgi:nucleoside-triphosphatase THEP1